MSKGRILFVDEDVSGIAVYEDELLIRDYDILRVMGNADEAYERLKDVQDITAIIIDVMLAANPASLRFSKSTTNDYTETGLALVSELEKVNPSQFPKRAILLSAATSGQTRKKIEDARQKWGITYLQKSIFTNIHDFGEKVEEVVRNLERT